MSDALKDGGPAYPVPTDMSGGEAFYLATPGMSLRDWFAGQAINAALSASWDAGMTLHQNASVAASWSYAIADAMLKARK